MHGMVTFADVLRDKFRLCFASAVHFLTPLHSLCLQALAKVSFPPFSLSFALFAKAVFLWLSAHCNLNVKILNLINNYILFPQL